METIPQSEDVTKVGAADFLSAFFPDDKEQICLATFKPKKAPINFTIPARWETSREDLITVETQNELSRRNEKNGIYFVVNAGGQKDEEITRFNAFFVERDSGSIEEQHSTLDAAPLPTSIRVETKNSVHAYWLMSGECTAQEWEDLQIRLISHFDGDPKNKNLSRCMRLPGFNHVTYLDTDNLSYKPVEVVQYEPKRRYTVAEMLSAFPAPERKEEPRTPEVVSSISSSDTQFISWDDLNDELKRRIMRAGRKTNRGTYEMRCPAHNGTGDTSLFYSPESKAVKCMSGCSHEAVLRAFGLPEKPITPRLIIGKRKGVETDEGSHRNNEAILTALIETPATDVGNAECMSVLYRSTMRYCHTRKRWLLWDGVRWKSDATEQACKLAVDMIRARQQAALDSNDSRALRAVGDWARSSENVTRIEAALKLSRVINPFATEIDRYDADPLLATTTNGTLDLAEGAFRSSDPEDYLSMQLGTAYEPDAKAPRWEKFLDEVFGGDEELIDYIQRAVGYSLTGETKEQNLFLCFGSGANGKSVFLEVLSRLLGDYAGAASFETFNAGNRNEAGYDLAVLKGKRFVTVIETDEDRYLDEAKVKAVTGQDVISCRFLYGNFFTYRPQFKIWMAMNHKPVIRGTDDGIWRRIHLIPFTQSFKDRADKDLVSKLCNEHPGILNWALEGLRKWREEGLRKPEAVEAATEEYRRESDSLGQWIEERMTKSPTGMLRAADGYKDYSAWSSERGERPFGLKKWGQSLVERGYKKDRDNKGVYYIGLDFTFAFYR